jgi:hypothetical protein
MIIVMHERNNEVHPHDDFMELEMRVRNNCKMITPDEEGVYVVNDIASGEKARHRVETMAYLTGRHLLEVSEGLVYRLLSDKEFSEWGLSDEADELVILR